MENFVIFLLIFAGVVGIALVVYHAVKGIKEKTRQPIIKAEAKVINLYSKNNNSLLNDIKYYIEFAFKDGSVLRFDVKRKHFVNINEGERGQIKFKAAQFISFKKEKQYKGVALGE